MSRFYVYTLAYPDGHVFYIGKGSGDRIDIHEHEARHGEESDKCRIIRQIWDEGGTVLKRKLYEHLSEQDALATESVLINLFDRANLANKQPGHKKGLPPKKQAKGKRKKPPKIIGYREHTWEKDGLFYQQCEPIYEEVSEVPV